MAAPFFSCARHQPTLESGSGGGSIMQCVGLTLAVRGMQGSSSAQPVTCRLHVAELAQALWEARTGAADIACSVDALRGY